MEYLDDQLFKKFIKLPPLHFYRHLRQTGVQAKAAKKEFFQTERPPRFEYEKLHNLELHEFKDHVERFEKSIPYLANNEAIAELYEEICAELIVRAELLDALHSGNDQKVTEYSGHLFGEIKQSVQMLQKEFNAMLRESHRFFTHERTVDAKLFIRMLEELLNAYEMHDWNIATHEGHTTHVVHGDPRIPPTIHVPRNLSISPKRAARLLAHEIEVHALRAENGRTSPLRILGKRLDRYVTTEEGLAIYFQQQINSKPPRHAPGFWNAWTNALTLQGTFTDTFRTIQQARQQIEEALGRENAYETSMEAAWRLCIRSYRGITHTGIGGVGYLRDHIYRSGLAMVTEFLGENPDDIYTLFQGKVGIHHVEIIRELNLPKPKIPKQIAGNIVKQVLK